LKNGIFFEDKSAKGLNRLNPRTGLPAQTPQQFADKQIFQKTRTRIENLNNGAAATRATKQGTQTVPNLDQISGINKFVFRFDANTPELRSATNVSLEKLRVEFPNYKFDATFGGKK